MRDIDVAFYNQQGLHGAIDRLWADTHLIQCRSTSLRLFHRRAMKQLPSDLGGREVCQRMDRIDDAVSNYWSNPDTANFKRVAAQAVRPDASYSVQIGLAPDALQLITLEPGRNCND